MLQVKLLKLLALLGAGDQGASENMYQVVAVTMREGAKHGNTIGNALVYEAVRTVTAIYPNPTLLQQGAFASKCAWSCLRVTHRILCWLHVDF